MPNAIVFVLTLVLPVSAHWWLIGQDVIEQAKLYGGAYTVSCSKYYLTADQERQCRDPGNRDFVISMGQGVNVVAHYCNSTFKNRRWNCPYVGGSHPFTRIAYQESRESAYLYAITSAMAMYTITRNCAKGKIDICGCGRKPEDPTDGFEWGKCTEDVVFGYLKSKAFVDAAETRIAGNYSASAKMNLHNNEAGRLMAKNRLVVKCQCHGFSGSCEMKTCWKEMIKWDEVFTNLQRKYDSSVHMQLNHGNEDLVYLKDSPNLCEPDASVGSLGTHNRRCNPRSDAENSCTVICCDRGHHAELSQTETLGRCRLLGLKLQCDVQMETITEHFCN